jgi:predicted membrane protein
MEKDRWDKEQWDREFKDNLHSSTGETPRGENMRDDFRNKVRDDARAWRERRRNRGSHGASGGVVAGAIIVAVGLVLLLDNMGIMHADHLWKFWPVILIAVGVGRIIECQRPAALIWGAMLCFFGGGLLLDNLNIISFSFNIIWPGLVIAFGISMLLKSTQGARVAGVGGPAGGVDPTLSLYAVFGGGRRRVTTDNFQGGEVLAIFGGYHIDLRGAQIPASGRAVVDINSIFGGVELIVPENWRIAVRGIGIFGAFEDKTIPPRPDVGVVLPELVVTGSAIFGGATVRN